MSDIKEKTSELHFRLIVKGFSAAEERLLRATVKLSERRQPVLELLENDNINIADIIIIDGTDERAVAWADNYGALLEKHPVVWVDAPARAAGHTSLKRPVIWVNLPIILSRVLDEMSATAAQSEMAKTQPKSQTATTQVSGDGLKILVVDDSPAVRQHMTTLLQQSGDKVIAAESGEEALAILDSRISDYFDCVFMDVLMPGMDGYAACREIKSRTKKGQSLPVIMLTGKSSPFDKIRGKMAGCSAYLTKPVAVERLRDTLRRVTKT